MSPVPRPSAGFVTTLVHTRGRARPRWRNTEGDRLYEWDELHGEWEVYTARGKHLGTADATTGKTVGPAVKGRSIDV